jgi:hypothetical protein
MSLHSRTYRQLIPHDAQALVRSVMWGGIIALLTTLLYFNAGLLALMHNSFATGYALSGGVLCLFALHIRKQLPSLPLGKMSSWVQIHVAIGYAVIVCFFAHVGWNLPRGFIEAALYLLFVLVAASGLYGVFISRTIPRQLRALEVEVIYERIGDLRRALAAEAREIVLQAATDTLVLAEFYRERLAHFLERPRGVWYYLYPTTIRRQSLIAELTDLHRYLNAERLANAKRLAEIMRRKDELDLHAALQGRLKHWMYLHIGMTYSLLIVAAVHVYLVHAYQGGW